MEKMDFTSKVLGPAAAHRLKKRKVTQTLRSESSSIASAILNGQVSAGDQLEVILDGIIAGHAEFIYMDAVTWDSLDVDDALRGGFDSLEDLQAALRRAGFRIKPLKEYHLFRIQFSWLDEVYV